MATLNDGGNDRLKNAPVPIDTTDKQWRSAVDIIYVIMFLNVYCHLLMYLIHFKKHDLGRIGALKKYQTYFSNAMFWLPA